MKDKEIKLVEIEVSHIRCCLLYRVKRDLGAIYK
jgi:hypothetical protein